MEPEVALVEAARKGDGEAFGRLVEMYQRPVFSLAYRMLGTASDAEDATQESFYKAYRALAGYDARRPFSTWLLSIAAHHCIDRIRRRRALEVSLDAMPRWRWQAAATIDPQKAVEEASLAEQVGAGLAALPEDYRLVVVLRYWHDLGYAEIAAILGESESAIKSRLHRARRRMAELIADTRAVKPGRRPESGRPTASDAAREGGTACNAIAPAS